MSRVKTREWSIRHRELRTSIHDVDGDERHVIIRIQDTEAPVLSGFDGECLDLLALADLFEAAVPMLRNLQAEWNDEEDELK